jgi:hypothetical protein
VLAVNAAFQQMSEAYVTKLAGRSGEACQMHPQSDAAAWSMQDVVEHLVLTYRASVTHLEKYLQRGSPTTRRADWKQFAARVIVVDLGRFPHGKPAPEAVRPGLCGIAAMDGKELGILFGEELRVLDEELVRCEKLFGARAFAPHFRFGPLSAKQWRKFHLVHGRHHLAQMERIDAHVRSREALIT